MSNIPERERQQLDILWGMFTVIEYITAEVTVKLGDLARPVNEKLKEIREALTDLEETR